MSDLETLNKRGIGFYPGLLGIEITAVRPGFIGARLPVRQELIAPNGYLHAGAVVGFADTACGYGVISNLPEGAQSFTTIELKSNFLGTCREGVITCEASMLHGGRTTQVWDAQVKDEAAGKTIALFRCTQMLIYPRS